jgi:RNA polymerase sigma-70 factor (ECF subfamily)
VTIDADAGYGPTDAGRRIEVVHADFDRFFAAELPALVRLLTALTGRRDLAEELAQEAMLRAHVRWHRLSTYDHPGAWVRRVATNLATNAWARRRNERRLVERLGHQPTPELDLPDDAAEFWTTVRMLPDRQATAVTLHYLEDRSVEDVARIMGCVVGTAKAHLHKGRQRLATLLDLPEDRP